MVNGTKGALILLNLAVKNLSVKINQLFSYSNVSPLFVAPHIFLTFHNQDKWRLYIQDIGSQSGRPGLATGAIWSVYFPLLFYIFNNVSPHNKKWGNIYIIYNIWHYFIKHTKTEQLSNTNKNHIDKTKSLTNQIAAFWGCTWAQQCFELNVR